MEPGSPVLEDLDGLMGLFGAHQSMDLDFAAQSLDLDAGRLAMQLEAPVGPFPGHMDLVSSALRSQPDATVAAVPVTVSDKDIRPSVPTTPHPVGIVNTAGAPQAAAVPVAPPPPAQFTIRPMPARKSNACKPVAVVPKAEPLVVAAPKPEAALPQPQPPQQQQVQQQQQAKPKPKPAAKQAKQQQQQQLQEEADTAFDSDSTEPSSVPGGKRRRRIRNAKQQELNRLAQQRYRERRKQKYSTLQDTVEELSNKLGELSTLEAANSELQQRNTQLESVVKEQTVQLQVQKDTISRQAQQLQTQAVQLNTQAKQLQAQVNVIQQQDKTLHELRSKLAAVDTTSANGGSGSGSDNNAAAAAGAADAEQLNDQIALAVRAVLTGVSSMATMGFPAAKDAAQMQQMVVQLPEGLLQQIRSCCREVALHLKKTEVKEQPHAISVPCC